MRMLIILILIWAVGLRAVELINGNYLFGHDQGRDLLIARSIVEDKKMTLIGNEVGSGAAGINGIFHGPGYHYVLALGYLLFRGDPYGAMVMMFLFGVGSLLVGYAAMRRIYGKWIALWILFFLSVSPLIVSQSRFIWSSHIATPLILIALYFVYRIKDDPMIFSPLACFAVSAIYHSQLGVSVPMVISVFLAMILIYRIRDPRIYILSVCAVMLGFAPMIAFEARHGFMAIRGLLGYLGSNESGSLVTAFARLRMHAPFYYFNFINTFTFEFGMLPYRIQEMSVLVFAVYVIYASLRTEKGGLRQFHWFLWLMTGVTWVSYLYLNNVVWDYYLMHLRIGYIVLFGYGVRQATNMLSRIAALVFVLVLLSGSIFRMYISYTSDLGDDGTFHKIRGKMAAIDAIYSDAAGLPFNVLTFVPYVYTYPYDYLFQTYAVRRYGGKPGKEKRGVVYLIIEPDYDKPWRHTGWLETVIVGGKTEFVKELPSGQILEKRIFED